MNKTWSVIITALITATVAVSATYYCLNNKAEEEKADLQSQIDELNNQIDLLQSQLSATASEEVTTDDKMTDWKTYVNDKYGFSLTFSDKWEGYRVDDWNQTHVEGPAPAEDLYAIYVPTSNKTFDADMPGYAKPFIILVYSKATYQSLRESDDTISGNVLGEKDNMVFVVSYWQDSPSDLLSSGLSSEIESVAQTFEFVE